MKRSYLLLIFALIIFTCHAQDESKPANKTASNVQTSPSTSTVHPTVITADSTLCKICTCYPANQTLDCSNRNMTSWFKQEEWDALRYGDIKFEHIFLNGNQLIEVPKFPRIFMKSLHLQQNRITKIASLAFVELGELEHLDLSGNLLTTKALTPDVFQGKFSPTEYEPMNLKSLNLASNDLHSLDPDIFEHFPQLETLNLSYNPFKIIDPLTSTAVSSLAFMKDLDMSYIQVDTLPEFIFHYPRELEVLRLSGNRFTKFPEAIGHAINLKVLYLDENLFAAIEGENIFSVLPKMEELHLSYCAELTSIGPQGLSGLENLKRLYITNNPKLATIHASSMARHRKNSLQFDVPELEIMTLHNNNLTILDASLLERWDKIKEIDLRNNPWKCTCENDFVIHVLFAQITQETPALAVDVKCQTPPAWVGIEIKDIFEEKKNLRCEDLYSNHPENDASVLIGMLVGLLVGIPLTFILLVIYRRGCFGLMARPGAAKFSRAFYSRTDEDDYTI